MTRDQKLVKSNLVLLELASYLGNVNRACETIEYSRDTFYRVEDLCEEAGIMSQEAILIA